MKNLMDDIRDALEEKAVFNKKVEELIDRFYKENPDIEVIKIIELVLSTGSPRFKNSMKQFKERYENNCLEIEDTFFYLDMYEMNKDSLKYNKEEL